MFEVVERAGLARVGQLTLEDVELRTPQVLFLRAPGLAAPRWAPAFIGTRRARNTLRLGGGTDRARAPLLSRPFSLAEVAFPVQEEAGDVAFLARPDDARESPREIVAPQNGVEYLRYPARLVHDLRTVRQAAGYQKAYYAPLLATPQNLALLAYSGVDLVDGLRVDYDAGRDRYWTGEGPIPIQDLEEWPCPCPACGRRDLRDHNRRRLATEAQTVREAIRRGALRELVEARVANDPWGTAVLRELDHRAYAWQELHAPVSGPPLRAYARESLYRPEVVRFRRRLRERYAKPPSAQVLLLLPCSARKPYSASKSHRLYRSILRSSGNRWTIHVVVVTSPLGLVPEELELAYPAQHYDVPVTGDWSEDEATILREDLRAYLKQNAYGAVVVHLGQEANLLEEVHEGAVVTARGAPRSREALEALEKTLMDVAGALPLVPRWQRRAEENTNRARFQFGAGGEAVTEGCVVKGRYPNLRYLAEGRQVAALVGERGLLSLTPLGASRLSAQDLSWVEIDDFHPEGNVFAIGVLDAHPEIRIGDDVVVRHEGEVRAVGVARMSPPEMIRSTRGQAVHVRHRVESPGSEG